MSEKFLLVLCAVLGITYSTPIVDGDRSSNGRHVRSNRVNTQHCHGVEYPGLGCFTLDPPFTNTQWLPQRPSFINTGFLLYTRENRNTPDTLYTSSSSSISRSHLNPQLPVKILVHGFLQYGGSQFLTNMTKALLDTAPMNVIVVSWGGGAGFPYTQAVANTRVVGAETAHLINTLEEVANVPAQQVHIIGHSLGAHIAGYAGSLVNGLGRITGLDPAQPNYSGFEEEVRLDSSDARFVDVIHTDGVPYDTVQGYGMIEPVGHVDFYPNGGHHQPGCHEESSVMDFFADAFRRGIANAELGLSCSHERSTELFTASVILSSSPGSSHCTFRAFPCESEESFLKGDCLHCGNRPCPIMGYDADKSFRARGVFYLNTTGGAQFCGYHYFVSVTLEPSMSYTDGVISVKLRGENGNTEWTPIKSGRINGGEVITNLILGDSDIGEIGRVDVKFEHDSGYFSWTSDTITLTRLEANSIMRFPSKYFCQSDMAVQDGRKLTLTGGSYHESDCQ